MKNPYIRNILILIIIIIVSTFIIIITCDCNENCWSNINISSTFRNIIIGLISSTLLLLLIEIFQYLSDRKLYGYLEGCYSRTILTDIIENSDIVKNEKREEDLTDSQRQKFKEKNLEPIKGTKYVKVLVYNDFGRDWEIKLEYLHHGIYKGTAEYHKYWEGGNKKTKVEFNLTLNQSNLTTGAGNYKYLDADDYGYYSFQVNGKDNTEILVTYKNTIPSGLSVGYEKWKRKNKKRKNTCG